MLLSREQILSANDNKTETVPVPEWGGSVRVRNLTGTERDALEFAIQENKANVRARFVALAVIGDDSKPIFSAGDVEALGEKSAAPIDRVFSKIQKLSGMDPKALEGAEKNSEATPIATSTSSSPKS